jgi:predicted  nucleic acid-binding Zn-ribbon protein
LNEFEEIIRSKEATIKMLQQELASKVLSFEREITELRADLVLKKREKGDLEKEIAAFQVELEEFVNRERVFAKK